MVGLVLTNDLHSFMFKLDLSQPGWSDNYGYGFLYYIIVVVLLLQLIGSIVIMFTKTKRGSKRFGIIFPLIFITVLAIYIVGYATRVPFFAESDVTMVYCVFTLLFLELCIRTGHIPVNTHYRDLFRSVGLKLQITDDRGNSLLTSDNSEPFDAELWDKLKNNGMPVYKNENTLILKNKISGGYAVWHEDVTSIVRLKAEIEKSNRQLETSNKLLSQIAQAKEKESQIKSRNILYAAFEKNIAVHEQKLTQMLRFPPIDDLEIPVYMGIVAILACFVKRQFNLLISEMNGNESVSSTEFAAYADELAELAKFTGPQFMIYCNLTGEINMWHAMLFYDFFYSIVEWTILKKGTGSFVNIVSENGSITMNLMLSADAVRYMLPEKLAEEINAAGGLFIKEDQGDITVLRMSLPEMIFPEGGDRNA
jgi:hypothetical protein